MAKLLKVAGIFGIVLLALTLITLVTVFVTIFSGGNVDDVLPKAGTFNIFTIFYLIIPLVSVGFLYGFIALGKRFSNKLLLVAGWFFVFFTILSFLANFLFIIGVDIFITPQIEAESSLQGAIFNIFGKIPFFAFALNLFGYEALWPILIIFFIVGFSLQLIFAIGIIKLKNNGVPFAIWCGWGEIIRMASDNISPAVITLEIIMFFKASKQFEQENPRVISQ